jgi:hypothetical protein
VDLLQVAALAELAAAVTGRLRRRLADRGQAVEGLAGELDEGRVIDSPETIFGQPSTGRPKACSG